MCTKIGMSLVPTSTPFNSLTLMNASSPLRIVAPDGSHQVVHPDVLFVSRGFLGFKYWMACTPYPFAVDRFENPIVRVSHDGINWQSFNGAPDPLVEAPVEEAWHHADTELVLHNNTLYVFYITTNSQVAGTQFSYIETTDGLIWTKPTVIYEGQWGVSPTFIVDIYETWSMWYVNRDSLIKEKSSKLLRRTGTAPNTLHAEVECQLEISGYIVWHLDVIAVAGEYSALVAAFPVDADPSRCRLFHAISKNGINFQLSQMAPVLKPSWFGWDNRMIYRSTFQSIGADRFRIWYSAASWGMRTGIGVVEGPIYQLRPVAYPSNSESLTTKIVEDTIGLLKYMIYLLLTPKQFILLLKCRAQLLHWLRR